MSGKPGDAGDATSSASGSSALELLAVARETLLEQVLPVLEGDARYQGLMIANAMAIALRELAPDRTDPAAELATLRGLYEHAPEEAGGATGEDPAALLARLEARLARDLRDGVLDGGPQFAVRRWLRARIESRLAVSNPRVLARRREEPGGGS